MDHKILNIVSLKFVKQNYKICSIDYFVECVELGASKSLELVFHKSEVCKLAC